MSNHTEIKPEAYFKNFESLPVDERMALSELTNITNQLGIRGPENIQSNVRIPLSHFNFFAPYFLGVKKPEDEYVRDSDQLRNMWLACCGSLQHDVDVFHDQNNTVVFTVPAYFDTDNLEVNPAMLSGHTFDRMRRNMEAERNFPSAAVGRYQHETNKRVDDMILDSVPPERRQRKAKMWAVIYNFYDIKLEQVHGYDASKNNPAPAPAAGFNVQSPFGSFGDFNSSL